MQRLLFIFLAASSAFAQTYPAFRWIKSIAGSGTDQVVGMGTDSSGNIYIPATPTRPIFRCRRRRRVNLRR